MTDPNLMSRDEVAALLGIKPNSVRDTLRRHGITEQRGYPREDVENLERPGRGYRSDLRRNTMITITDQILGTTATIEKYDVVDTLRGWYENAPDDVRSAVLQLEEALLQGEPTAELEAYLAVQVEPAS